MRESTIKELVTKAGGEYVGIQHVEDGQDLVLFNDPITESTIAVPYPYEGISFPEFVEQVYVKMHSSRALFMKPKGDGLSLEIAEIRRLVAALLPYICTDKTAIEKQMLALARLDVLQYYLETHEIKR